MPDRPDLHLDVYVAPMRPMRGAPARDRATTRCGRRCASTLIRAPSKAVLVDTLVTLDQVDALADWVRGFGKRHHRDLHHPRPLRPLDRPGPAPERFPDARSLATRRSSSAPRSRPPTRACPPTGSQLPRRSCPRPGASPRR